MRRIILNTTALSHRAFPFRAGIFTLCLLAVPGVCAAKASGKLASDGQPVAVKEAEAKNDPSPELVREIAREAKTRALFEAELYSALGSLARDSDRPLSSNDMENLLHSLWSMRSQPAIQQEWRTYLLSGKGTARTRYREFSRFSRRVLSIARDLSREATQEGDRQNVRPLNLKRRIGKPSVNEAAERQHRELEFHTKALIIANLMHKNGIQQGESLTSIVWAMRDKPESLRALAGLDMREIDFQSAAAARKKLLAAPEKAPEIVEQVRKDALDLKRYRASNNGGTGRELIGLPVEALRPDATDVFRKAGTQPLAASKVSRLPWGVSVTRVAELFPIVTDENAGEAANPLGKRTDGKPSVEERGPMMPLPFGAKPVEKTEADAREQAAKLPRPAFLKPGEHLYAVYPQGRGKGSVFQGSPLTFLEYYGPRVVEFRPVNSYCSGAKIANAPEKMRPASARYPFLLIAATCTLEELQQHLASLSVMETERERSLYGQCSERVPFTAREEAEEYSVKDTPGKTLRFVNASNPALFFGLIRAADGMGAARLLGPIRGVWIQDMHGSDLPWLQLRYEPVSALHAAPAKLGETPVLSLSADALRGVADTMEERMLNRTAMMKVSRLEKAKADASAAPGTPGTSGASSINDAREAALKALRPQVAYLKSKGILAPWDLGKGLNWLDMAEKLLGHDAVDALLSDTLQSPAVRLNNLRKATVKARDEAAKAPQKPEKTAQ